MAIIENPGNPMIAQLKGLHLFHFESAPCAQRVRFALHEKGLARGREVLFDNWDEASCHGDSNSWVSRHVSLRKKEHMTEAYAAINPNLVVPTLVHDGVLHIDSMDIIEYLDNTFGGTPLVPKANAEQEEDARELTEFGRSLHRSIRFTTFRWGLKGLARLNDKQEQNLLALLKSGSDKEQLQSFYQGFDSQTIPDSVYDEHLQKLNSAFKQMEQRLSDGRQFLTGDSLTMADIMWAMKTLRLIECGYPFARCFPRYYKWYSGIAARPSWQQGVMLKHGGVSNLFKAKAAIENILGFGLRKKVISQVA